MSYDKASVLTYVLTYVSTYVTYVLICRTIKAVNKKISGRNIYEYVDIHIGS